MLLHRLPGCAPFQLRFIFRGSLDMYCCFHGWPKFTFSHPFTFMVCCRGLVYGSGGTPFDTRPRTFFAAPLRNTHCTRFLPGVTVFTLYPDLFPASLFCLSPPFSFFPILWDLSTIVRCLHSHSSCLHSNLPRGRSALQNMDPNHFKVLISLPPFSISLFIRFILPGAVLPTLCYIFRSL